MNDVDVDYQIETWNDEDFYEISLLDEALTKISFTSNNGLLEYITWDLDGSADKIHRGDSLLISLSGSYDAQLEVRDSSAILITISFVKKND